MTASPDVWPAPTATAPISATVTMPGSKSVTNRALILAALAEGRSTIHGALRSRDTDLMMGALRAMGTVITDAGTTLHVEPHPLRGGTVDCGLAGTVMRFVPPVAVLAKGAVFLDGDPEARRRPMGATVESLRHLGAQIDSASGSLPLTVTGTGHVAGGEVHIDASASSQFISGLLLAGARYDEGITVVHTGGAVPSLPHIDMTVDMLREAGVTVEHEGSTWTVQPGPIAGRTWMVEPDLSNASAFLAAAVVTGGTVRIPQWPQHTTQAGDQSRIVLEQMGAEVTFDAASSTLEVRGTGEIRGLTMDLHDIGELTPTIAAVAALASTPSHLYGIAHLRGHETDRLSALCTEITKLGGDVEETADGLKINPAPLHGGVWHSYADHRMATAGAIIGLAVEGVGVEDIGTTAKTLPDFAERWATMLRG